MIKNVFIPEKIGSYYLFPKRIIGFDVGKTNVHACQLYMYGNKITIEKCLEERIAPGENADYPEHGYNLRGSSVLGPCMERNPLRTQAFKQEVPDFSLIYVAFNPVLVGDWIQADLVPAGKRYRYLY